MQDINPEQMRFHEIDIRVRYCETDAQGRLHHAHFINYFEMGRTELMRQAGVSYREFEESGMMLVIREIQIQYLRPARYDDLLRLRTTTVRAKGARVVHQYELFREDELLATGSTTVASIRPDGAVARLPDWMCLD